MTPPTLCPWCGSPVAILDEPQTWKEIAYAYYGGIDPSEAFDVVCKSCGGWCDVIPKVEVWFEMRRTAMEKTNG